MQREYKVSYNWNNPTDKKLDKETTKILEVEAWDRITNMIDVGYVSGELYAYIRFSKENKSIEFRGWWKMEALCQSNLSKQFQDLYAQLGDSQGFCGNCKRVFFSDPDEHEDYDCIYCGSENTIF